MFQGYDPFLDQLRLKPMMMADEDNYEEEEEEDLFSDEVLKAAAGEDEPPPEEVAPPAPEAPPPPSHLFSRPGIRRSVVGYGAFTVFGLIPIVMLLLLMILQKGLSSGMMLFLVAMVLGWLVSFYNVFYLFRHGNEFTVSFNLRAYFKWPEVALITVILLGLSFWNLNNLAKGKFWALTGKPMVIEQDDSQIETTTPEVKPQEEHEEATHPPRKRRLPAGGAVSILGAGEEVQNKFNTLLPPSDPQNKTLPAVVGGGVGAIGSKQIPDDILYKKIEVEQDLPSNPLFHRLFLGGTLAAAFGYALVMGIAGMLFAILRKFETPFSQKYIEIINIQTNEIKVDYFPISSVKKGLNVVARLLIGLSFGATLGFVLGLVVVVPMYTLFHGELTNPQVAAIFKALGVITNPDMAFVHSVILGGFLIPLIIAIVTKIAPVGMAVSEELLRAHYELKPIAIPAGAPGSPEYTAGTISEPAIIQFGSEPAGDELRTTSLLEELSMDEDNLTSEIVHEFGRELEQVFGIDASELIGTKANKRQAGFDKHKMGLALDESFGELGQVPVEISAELGQASILVTDWLNLKEGTLLVLDKPANEEIDLLFNGVRKGKGKLMLSDNALAVKVSTAVFHSGNGHHS